MSQGHENDRVVVVEGCNMMALVERGLEAGMAGRVAKQYSDKCAELKRLTELLLGAGANRYWEGRWLDEKAENERLRAALEEARRDLNGLCPRSDTGSKRKTIIENAVKRIETALNPEQKASGSVDRGNALLKAQEEARAADGRPGEDIIRAHREEWRS